MSLPLQLIDRILKSLHDDPKSLPATSLVSKDWTNWGQAYLFESVHLTLANLQCWLKNTPLDVDGPASHTCTLALEGMHIRPWVKSRNSDFLLSNLASFRYVGSLVLVQWDVTNDALVESYFDRFGKSLGALSLVILHVRSSDPLRSLIPLSKPPTPGNRIPFPPPHSLHTMSDIPEVIPSFCGMLSLTDLYSNDPIFKAVAILPVYFTTISIQSCFLRP